MRTKTISNIGERENYVQCAVCSYDGLTNVTWWPDCPTEGWNVSIPPYQNIIIGRTKTLL